MKNKDDFTPTIVVKNPGTNDIVFGAKIKTDPSYQYQTLIFKVYHWDGREMAKILIDEVKSGRFTKPPSVKQIFVVDFHEVKKKILDCGGFAPSFKIRVKDHVTGGQVELEIRDRKEWM